VDILSKFFSIDIFLKIIILFRLVFWYFQSIVIILRRKLPRRCNNINIKQSRSKTRGNMPSFPFRCISQSKHNDGHILQYKHCNPNNDMNNCFEWHHILNITFEKKMFIFIMFDKNYEVFI